MKTITTNRDMKNTQRVFELENGKTLTLEGVFSGYDGYCAVNLYFNGDDDPVIATEDYTDNKSNWTYSISELDEMGALEIVDKDFVDCMESEDGIPCQGDLIPDIKEAINELIDEMKPKFLEDYNECWPSN